MTVELRDLICFLALAAEALPEAARSAIDLLYAAGASDGLGVGPLAAGGAAGGVAGGAAAGGPLSDPMRNPRLPGPEDDVGDATSPYQQLENARDGAPLHPSGPGPLLRFSRVLGGWAESVMGVDTVGTVPSSGKA